MAGWTNTAQALPSWQYDSAAGSGPEAAAAGFSSLTTYAATLGGLGNTSGLFTMQEGDDGRYRRTVDPRVAISTGVTAMAGAASGAALFCQSAGPGGAIAGAVLGVLGAAVTGGFAAYDAQKTVASLKKIQEKIDAAKSKAVVKLDIVDDLDVVEQCLQYCMGKQQIKVGKSAATALIVGQPLVPVVKGMKAIYKQAKGTKGVNRAGYAKKLVEISKKPDGVSAQLAREIIGALLAKQYDSIMTDTVANAMKSG